MVLTDNLTRTISDYIDIIKMEYEAKTGTEPTKLYLSRTMYNKLKNEINKQHDGFVHFNESMKYKKLWIHQIEVSNAMTWILGC